MNERLEKYIKLFKNPKNLMLLGAVCIALIALSSLTSKTDKQEQKQDSTSITAEDYKTAIEEDIVKTVKEITGSKKVSVIITLKSGIKYSYADTREESATQKQEKENLTSDSTFKDGYITVKNADGGEEALLVTAEMPEIRGVAIVCEGGDNSYIAEKIKNAVTAALDINSRRVYICGRNT